jgi:hypothetical protein
LAESGYKPDFSSHFGGDHDGLTDEEWIERLVRSEPKIPTFEDWSGLSASGVLTRIERQCGGGKIPDFFRDEKGHVTVSTVWNRLKNGYKGEMFDPYEALVFIDESDEVIPQIPMSFKPREFAVIRGLQAHVLEQGMQKTCQTLNARSRGGSRLIITYAEYLPAEKLGASLVHFSRNELFQQFRCSIQKQFGCAA